VSFAERLISEPQREKSGETGYERYDYQALWGLALIFEHHASLEDYAIAFEFHDDIVLLNSASSPTLARFYQVKTKDSGHWTLSDLYRRNKRKGDPSGGKLPSHIGKLFSNYVVFPDETQELNFVSNVPCAFLDAATSTCHFTQCDAETLAKFMKKMNAEYPEATPATAGLIRYVRADLSLHDSSAHIKGKLNEFVLSQIGSVEYNPDTLYKTIVEECRTRSKYTGGVSDFLDLIKFKSITRTQVEGWLDQVRSRHALPDWAEISNHLNVSGMELAELSREWKRYRAIALDPGNEAINALRDTIRKELVMLVGTRFGLTELIDDLYSKVEDLAVASMPPFKPARLKAMIIYEVFNYDPTGEVQKADPLPSEAKL
jgi:Cap4 dsDNA endonuclease